MNLLNRRSFLAYLLLFLVGCTAPNVTNSSSVSDQPNNQAESLRLAVSDVQGKENLEAEFGEFRDVLSRALKMPVELVPVDNFFAAAPALLNNQIDIVFAGPSEYLVLNARAQAVPITAVTRPDYYSVIVVRADSDIQNLDQLKGKTVGMRTAGSTAGHIGISTLLQNAGLNPTGDYDAVMMGNGGIPALMAGKIDALGDSGIRIPRFLQEEGLTQDAIRILAEGPPLPNDVFMVRRNLDSDLSQKIESVMLTNQAELLEAMIAAPANAKYRTSEFVVANDEDYDEIREMYSVLGLESLIK